MASAAAMPESARVDATDRSIWPAMITKVMPIATIDTSVVCRPMFRKLSIDKNHGEAKLKTTQKDDEGQIEHPRPFAAQKRLHQRRGPAPFGRRRNGIGRKAIRHAACPCSLWLIWMS